MRAVALLLLAGLAAAPSHAAPAAKKAPAPGTPDRVTRAQVQAEAKKIFEMADTNHDGFMSHAEFRVRMRAVLNRTPPGTANAPTKEGAQRLLEAADNAFKDVDTNHDGKLSLAEASARSLALFDAMDANHDGVVTRAERAAAVSKDAARGPSGPTLPAEGR